MNLYLAVYMLGGYIFVRNVVRNSALLYQSSLFVLHLFEKQCDEPLMGETDLQPLLCTPTSRYYVDVVAILRLLLSRYPVTQQRFALDTSGVTGISGLVLGLQ